MADLPADSTLPGAPDGSMAAASEAVPGSTPENPLPIDQLLDGSSRLEKLDAQLASATTGGMSISADEYFLTLMALQKDRPELFTGDRVATFGDSGTDHEQLTYLYYYQTRAAFNPIPPATGLTDAFRELVRMSRETAMRQAEALSFLHLAKGHLVPPEWFTIMREGVRDCDDAELRSLWDRAHFDFVHEAMLQPASTRRDGAPVVLVPALLRAYFMQANAGPLNWLYLKRQGVADLAALDAVDRDQMFGAMLCQLWFLREEIHPVAVPYIYYRDMTMAVAVQSIAFTQALFILLHETGHLALHLAEEGAAPRPPQRQHAYRLTGDGRYKFALSREPIDDPGFVEAWPIDAAGVREVEADIWAAERLARLAIGNRQHDWASVHILIRLLEAAEHVGLLGRDPPAATLTRLANLRMQRRLNAIMAMDGSSDEVTDAADEFFDGFLAWLPTADLSIIAAMRQRRPW